MQIIAISSLLKAEISPAKSNSEAHVTNLKCAVPAKAEIRTDYENEGMFTVASPVSLSKSLLCMDKPWRVNEKEEKFGYIQKIFKFSLEEVNGMDVNYCEKQDCFWKKTSSVCNNT